MITEACEESALKIVKLEYLLEHAIKEESKESK
jgi:hypothetical protein